jgi:hypothetical protein
MGYAALVKLLLPLARKYGPKVIVAVVGLLKLYGKNPQAKKFAEDAIGRLQRVGRHGRLATQVGLAKEFATEALTEESVPERQELARAWLQRAKVLEMALRASRTMPRTSAKKLRLAEVAAKSDGLLAEIIETRAKWSES